MARIDFIRIIDVDIVFLSTEIEEAITFGYPAAVFPVKDGVVSFVKKWFG